MRDEEELARQRNRGNRGDVTWTRGETHARSCQWCSTRTQAGVSKRKHRRRTRAGAKGARVSPFGWRPANEKRAARCPRIAAYRPDK